jgi:hypothetical protein
MRLRERDEIGAYGLDEVRERTTDTGHARILRRGEKITARGRSRGRVR